LRRLPAREPRRGHELRAPADHGGVRRGARRGDDDVHPRREIVGGRLRQSGRGGERWPPAHRSPAPRADGPAVPAVRTPPWCVIEPWTRRSTSSPVRDTPPPRWPRWPTPPASRPPGSPITSVRRRPCLAPF